MAEGENGKVARPVKEVTRAGFGKSRKGWKYLIRCVVLESLKAEATGLPSRASADHPLSGSEEKASMSL